MNTIEVPCARCDEFRDRLVSHGYVVDGCDPIGDEMCRISYHRPDEVAAAAAAAAPGDQP